MTALKASPSGSGRRPFSPLLALVVLGVIWFWPSAPGPRQPLRQRRFLMDTLVTITAYPTGTQDGNQVLDRAFGEISRIEDLFTSYRDSPLQRWNSQGTLARSQAPTELLQGLHRVKDIYRLSQGHFDPSLGRLKTAWGFGPTVPDPRIPPSPGALAAALARCGMDHLEETSDSLILTGGTHLDLGGFAKGLAVDAAVELLTKAGFSALVDAGGDMACTGPKPDGSPWKIGVRDPKVPEGVLQVLELSQGAVATSGNYERFFEYRGERFHHLLSPATGRPADFWTQTTVLAPTCAAADAWATAYFVASPGDAHVLVTGGGPPALLLPPQGEAVRLGAFPPSEVPIP